MRSLFPLVIGIGIDGATQRRLSMKRACGHGGQRALTLLHGMFSLSSRRAVRRKRVRLHLFSFARDVFGLCTPLCAGQHGTTASTNPFCGRMDELPSTNRIVLDTIRQTA